MGYRNQVALPLNQHQSAALHRKAAELNVTPTHVTRIALMQFLGLPVDMAQPVRGFAAHNPPAPLTDADPLVRTLKQAAQDKGVDVAVEAARVIARKDLQYQALQAEHDRQRGQLEAAKMEAFKLRAATRAPAATAEVPPALAELVDGLTGD